LRPTTTSHFFSNRCGKGVDTTTHIFFVKKVPIMMILEDNSRDDDASCESESSSSSATRFSDVAGRESGEANTSHQSEEDRRKAVLIKKEERTVWSLKLLVLACAISVCIAMYVIARRNDIHSFQLEVRFESSSCL
jgi:hypothetical protein